VKTNRKLQKLSKYKLKVDKYGKFLKRYKHYEVTWNEMIKVAEANTKNHS